MTVQTVSLTLSIQVFKNVFRTVLMGINKMSMTVCHSSFATLLAEHAQQNTMHLVVLGVYLVFLPTQLQFQQLELKAHVQ